MRLVHVADKKNLDSICENGLDPKYATGKRRAVWAVTVANESWAIAHTLGKKRAKGRTIHDHVTIEIEVPRSWLRRHAKGVWYCDRVIPMERFVYITPSAQIGEDYPC